MNDFTPLLAAAGDIDIVRILIVLLILIIPAIGQLLAKIRQIQQQQPGAQPPQAPPVAADLADEIEEFMRRTAQHRGTQSATPAPAEPKPKAAKLVPAETVAEPQPVGGQVSEHVRKYLDEQEFRRRGERLGKEVGQADRQLDQHLHEVFDHRVSKLEAVGGESAASPINEESPELAGVSGEAPSAVALGLIGAVTSPEMLRQAIILNEILHRPEERWG